MNYVVMFPGQGSQYSGMCTQYIGNYKIISDILSEASDILHTDIISMVKTGNMSTLTDTRIAQPLVLAVSYAQYKVLEQILGVPPSLISGHSLGEITAYVASGAINFADALSFVQKRANLMHHAYEMQIGCSSVVVDVCLRDLLPLLSVISKEQFIGIACFNSPSQYVVAGERCAMDALDKQLHNLNIQLIPYSMIPMKVNAPYHTKLMSYLDVEISAALKLLPITTPSTTVISSVDGKHAGTADIIMHNLSSQLTRPVQWEKVMSSILSDTLGYVIEAGPGSSLTNMLLNDYRYEKCLALDDVNESELCRIFHKESLC